MRSKNVHGQILSLSDHPPKKIIESEAFLAQCAALENLCSVKNIIYQMHLKLDIIRYT